MCQGAYCKFHCTIWIRLLIAYGGCFPMKFVRLIITMYRYYFISNVQFQKLFTCNVCAIKPNAIQLVMLKSLSMFQLHAKTEHSCTLIWDLCFSITFAFSVISKIPKTILRERSIQTWNGLHISDLVNIKPTGFFMWQESRIILCKWWTWKRQPR